MEYPSGSSVTSFQNFSSLLTQLEEFETLDREASIDAVHLASYLIWSSPSLYLLPSI